MGVQSVLKSFFHLDELKSLHVNDNYVYVTATIETSARREERKHA